MLYELAVNVVFFLVVITVSYITGYGIGWYLNKRGK